MSDPERVYCQFCRETHPAERLGGLPFPLVKCPLMPPDRVLIVPTAEGVRSVTWEPEDATQDRPSRYNPDQRLPIPIHREPAMMQEPDFAVAVRRGLARRRRAHTTPPLPEPVPGRPNGTGGEADRERFAGMRADHAEASDLTWRNVLDYEIARAYAAADDELDARLADVQATVRHWRASLAVQPAADPEQTEEQPQPEGEAWDVPEYATHFMDGDSTTPLCGSDEGDKPVRGTDRPELVTCGGCKAQFEARFTQSN